MNQTAAHDIGTPNTSRLTYTWLNASAHPSTATFLTEVSTDAITWTVADTSTTAAAGTTIIYSTPYVASPRYIRGTITATGTHSPQRWALDGNGSIP